MNLNFAYCFCITCADTIACKLCFKNYALVNLSICKKSIKVYKNLTQENFKKREPELLLLNIINQKAPLILLHPCSLQQSLVIFHPYKSKKQEYRLRPIAWPVVRFYPFPDLEK